MSRLEMDEDGYRVKCGYLITVADACGDCKLNPRNKLAPSARLARIFRIQRWQAAGATFRFTDLLPGDWDDLAALKSEQHSFEIAQLKKRRRQQE